MGGLFITGTDTDAGKTLVGAAIARIFADAGETPGVMKPVASGVETPPGHDAEWLMAGARVRHPHDLVCPYHFRAPLSPHLAARREGESIRPAGMLGAYSKLAAHYDPMIVEGAGGWYAPMARGYFMAHLAQDLRLPVLIVAANRLGCVNHVLLTIESIRALRLTAAGVILNGGDPDDEAVRTNPETLMEMTDCPLVGVLPRLPQMACEETIARAAELLRADVLAWWEDLRGDGGAA